MKNIAVILTMALSAGAAFAAGPELNDVKAGDVAAAMAQTPIALPSQPSKYSIITPVQGQAVTLDNSAGRMWVTDPEAAGIGELYSWSAGKEACEKLNYAGFSDWELPTDQELLGLVDGHFSNPALDAKYFLNTRLGYYWTATDYPENSFLRRVWTVSFKGGGLYYATVMGNRYNIRCVRPANK